MSTGTDNGNNGAKIDAATRFLLEATLSTISAVCKTQPNLKSQRTEAKVDGEKVIAVVSLIGDVEVNLFLGMPSGTAVALASKFAGFAIPFESSDMADAVGELANLIAGDLKMRLNRNRIKANISVPMVFRGHELVVTTPSWEIATEHYFNTECGDFMAGLCSKKKNESPARP
jgi:chemotaxis protein CheX